MKIFAVNKDFKVIEHISIEDHEIKPNLTKFAQMTTEEKKYKKYI